MDMGLRRDGSPPFGWVLGGKRLKEIDLKGITPSFEKLIRDVACLRIAMVRNPKVWCLVQKLR